MIANNGEIEFRYKWICKFFIWDGGAWNRVVKSQMLLLLLLLYYIMFYKSRIIPVW
jgi:hypothetical protein